MQGKVLYTKIDDGESDYDDHHEDDDNDHEEDYEEDYEDDDDGENDGAPIWTLLNPSFTYFSSVLLVYLFDCKY